MDFLEKMGYKLDPVAAIQKALEKWSPTKYETEKDYEESLYGYLHKKFDDSSIDIAKQSAVGRKKADIRIGKEAIIELKKDLDNTGQYDRLMGQIEEYLQWEGTTFIILVGKSDLNLKKKLIQKAKSSRSMHGFDFVAKLIVLEK